MNLKSTACRIIRLCFLLTCLVHLPVTVFSQETILTTSVPACHILRVEFEGKGIVTVDGVAYVRTTDIKVDRHSEVDITVLAANGYRTKTVLWNKNNVTTAIKQGTWKSPVIDHDSVLTISFERISANPMTGDSSNIINWSLLTMTSIFCIAVCLMHFKKKVA